MSNDYFESADHETTPGLTIRSAEYNMALAAIEDGFDVLPDEDEITQGLINYATTVGGTGDAITATVPHGPSSYTGADGWEVVFKCPGTNTGAATINPNGLGAKTIVREDGSTLVAGDLASGHIRSIRYNETDDQFEIMGTFSGTAGTMSLQNASAVAITGGTMASVTLTLITIESGSMTGGTVDSVCIEESLKKFGAM